MKHGWLVVGLWCGCASAPAQELGQEPAPEPAMVVLPFGPDAALPVVSNVGVARCFEGLKGDFVVLRRAGVSAVAPEVPAQVTACVQTRAPQDEFWAMTLRVSAAGFGAVPKVVGGVPEMSVRKTLAKGHLATDCQLEAHRRGAMAEGAAILRFEIREGRVEQASLVGSHFKDAAFEACVLGNLRRMVFEASAQPTSVSFPLTMRLAGW